MSNGNLTSVLKSCSEGELINGESVTMTPNQSDASRLKRTFTLPRNPFGNGRISLRRITPDCDRNSNESSSCSNDTDFEGDGSSKKLFRRPSWRKFVFKISQHLNSATMAVTRQSSSSERVPSISLEDPGGLPNNLQYDPWPEGLTPGVVGLRNHGNTCYMNAVMQCLSHTDALAKYFVLDHYKVDMLKRNKLNSKKYGTKGELTEQLALLLKSLWGHHYKPDFSLAFKSAVERHGPVFRGSSQHDAQEFLFWLLDKVHEDLNTATKKKYKTIKNSCGRPDEVVAAETLANHTRRNSSFVQDVFQAQYRSALTCVGCHGTSCTFDPFHCVSVQLPPTAVNSPTQTLAPMKVTVKMVYNGIKDDSKSPEVEVEIPPSSMITDNNNSLYNIVRKVIHSNTKLAASSIVLASIQDTGWRPFDADALQSNCDFQLYCMELATPGVATPSNPPPDSADTLDSITPYITILWINCTVRGDKRSVIGEPHLLRIARESNYEDFTKLLLKENSQAPENCHPTPRFRLLQPHLTNYYVQSELPHPLYAEEVESALVASLEDAEGPVHVKMEIEWEVEEIKVPSTAALEESHKCPVAKDGQISPPGVTLESCLLAYTLPERLEAGAWRCPSCRRARAAHKTLGLWSLPAVLLIHLKRFSQQQMRGRKLTTAVHFPLKGLDMSAHVRRGSSSNLSAGSASNQMTDSTGDYALYDLYAVCYHHGTDVGAGHYTACCLSAADGRWYKYDDAHVTTVSPDDLIHPSAYMLFYKKRISHMNSTPHWSWHLPAPTGSASQNTISPEKEEILCKDMNGDDENVTSETTHFENDLIKDALCHINSTISLRKNDTISNRISPILEFSDEQISLGSTKVDSASAKSNMEESTFRTCSRDSPSRNDPITTPPTGALPFGSRVQCSLLMLREPQVYKVEKLPCESSLPIHKDVHVNPKMTHQEIPEEAVAVRTVSSNVRHSGVTSYVSSVNGLEYEERLLEEENALLAMMLCSQSPPSSITNVMHKICVD